MAGSLIGGAEMLSAAVFGLACGVAYFGISWFLGRRRPPTPPADTVRHARPQPGRRPRLVMRPRPPRPVPTTALPPLPPRRPGPMTEADRLARGDLGEAGVRRGLEALGIDLDHSLNFRAGADGTGRTVQVDVLARLPNGHLVVLEVKAYGGTIIGKPGGETWRHNGHAC